MKFRYLASFLALTLPLTVTLLIYIPGISGDFLFDDIANFQPLENSRDYDDATRVKLFVLTGNAGPTGRPLSLLSFMINDNAWPTDPGSFKYTNLMFHLLCGVLIFWMIWMLARALKMGGRRSLLLASIGAVLWMAHPIQVSTVLYVIQRMTILGTLFSLAAIIGYLYGRRHLPDRPGKAYALMSTSLAGFGILSLISKEIALLIPIYVLVIEYCLMEPGGHAATRGLKIWRLIFLWLPFCILLAYFANIALNSHLHFGSRPYTLAERLLTEPRVVLEYLKICLLPQLEGRGLFHDDYIKSTGLMNPPETLYAILVLLALVISAIFLRRKAPVFSFSILWFLGGHILESSFISVELYIEHRNYLPVLGPMFGLSYFALSRRWKYPRFAVSLLGLYTLLHVAVTAYDAWLWGNPILSTVVWAEENPDSIRAQQAASNAAFRLQDYKRGRQYLQTALDRHPHDSALIMQLIQVDCTYEKLPAEEFPHRISSLSNSTYSHATIPTLIMLVSRAGGKTCDALTYENLHKIIDALLVNDTFQSPQLLHFLHYWKGMTYAEQRQLNEAMEELDHAYQYVRVMDVPMQQALWLISAGLFSDAETYLKKAEDIHRRVKNPLLSEARKKDIENLAAIIRKAKHASEEHKARQEQ